MENELTQEQLATIRYKTRRLTKDDPIGLVQMLNEAYRLGQGSLRKDAERYQWLRHGDNDERVLCFDPYADLEDEDAVLCWLPRTEELDRLIDEAIQEDAATVSRPATAEETAAIDAAMEAK